MSAEAILRKIFNECYVSHPMHVVDGEWKVKNPNMLIIDGTIELTDEENVYLNTLFVEGEGAE